MTPFKLAEQRAEIAGMVLRSVFDGETCLPVDLRRLLERLDDAPTNEPKVI